MTPIDDIRPFPDVLRDWMARRGQTAYATGPALGVTKHSVAKWLAGDACPHHRAFRALMTLIDEGRVTH